MISVLFQRFQVWILQIGLWCLIVAVCGRNMSAAAEPAPMLSLNADEREWLAAHPAVRVGVDPEFAPYEFIGENGEYQGMAADYVKYISDALGVEFVVMTNLTWSEVVEKTKKQEIDVLPCVGITEERKAFLNFSQPYLGFPRVIVTEWESHIHGIEDLEGKRVAVERNSSHHGYVVEDAGLNPVFYDTFLEALKAVVLGDADAAIGNLAVVDYDIRKYGLTNLKVAARISADVSPLCFAVRKDWPELLSLLDKVLSGMSPEQGLSIRSKWANEHAAITLKPEDTSVFYGGRFVLISLLSVFLGVLVLQGFSFLVQRKLLRGSIHRMLFSISMLLTWFFLAITFFAVLLFRNDRKSHEINEQWYRAMALAEELRQSSDDLTRFARTYTVTGDPLYEKYFGAVVAIRDGKQPHPINWTISYWDLVTGNQETLDECGELYRLEDRIMDLDLTEQERFFFSESKRESDALIYMEDTAMNAVKGRFRDETGRFTRVDVPDLVMAREITHGPAYHCAKGRMMSAAGRFFSLVKGRVERELEQAHRRSDTLLLILVVLSAFEIGIAVYAFHLFRRKVIGPLHLLEDAALRMDQGDYSGQIPMPSDDEIGALAQAFNSMSEQVLQRTAELTSSEERFRNIYEGSNDAMMLITHKGFYDCNVRALEMFDVETKEEFVTLHLADISPPAQPDGRDSLSAAQMNIETACREGYCRFEWMHRRRSGADFPAEVLLSAFRQEGEIVLQATIRDITRRKMQQARLEESQAGFKRLVNDIGDDFLIFSHTPEGQLLHVSDGFEKMFGVCKEFVSGRTWMEVINWLPESLDYATIAVTAMVTGEKSEFHYDMYYIHPDGTKRIIDVSEHPVFGADGEVVSIDGIAQDVTEQRMAEEALQVSRDRYERTANTLPVMLFDYVVYPGGMDAFLYAARQPCYELFELDSEELCANSELGWDLVLPEDLSELRRAVAETLRKHELQIHFEFRIILPSCVEKWILMTARAKPYKSGDPALFSGFMQDVTDRKMAALAEQLRNEELERTNLALRNSRRAALSLMQDAKSQRQRAEYALTELQQSQDELFEAKEAAEAASMAKSEFLAGMSHELRTPLNSVIGFAEVLEARYFGELNDKQSEYVNDIVNSGRHLLSLINDVLDLSKMEAGKMVLTPIQLRIDELLRGCLMLIKEKCMKHGIDLVLSIPKEVQDLQIDADERMLKQIVFNLLSNASKFTPDGGRITLGAEIVEEDASDPFCPVVEIFVEDTGIGIAQKDQEKVFEKFFQTRQSLQGKTPGTGLGLSLVRQFVALHGGRVWVESPGEQMGSRFSFTLPRHPPAPESEDEVL